MDIDHIGIVVRSIEDGIAHWQRVFGYRQMTEIVLNTRQKVKVVFLDKKNSITIKLIEPSDDTSPVYTFAKKGGGLHHLCFKCNSIDRELSRFKELGLRLLAGPQPGEAFDNENIAFVFGKQGLNIELIDTDKRAGLIPRD
jgi:methylmalonyl-CoA/ethylmalonyl-CoA epimerase